MKIIPNSQKLTRSEIELKLRLKFTGIGVECVSRAFDFIQIFVNKNIVGLDLKVELSQIIIDEKNYELQLTVTDGIKHLNKIDVEDVLAKLVDEAINQ